MVGEMSRVLQLRMKRTWTKIASALVGSNRHSRIQTELFESASTGLADARSWECEAGYHRRAWLRRVAPYEMMKIRKCETTGRGSYRRNSLARPWSGHDSCSTCDCSSRSAPTDPMVACYPLAIGKSSLTIEGVHSIH
jgi:hypothetical protein